MYDSVAIIPARGGSKRLKDKNIKKLSNLSLIEHTILAAYKSKCFKKIIISTDSTKIIKICSKYKFLTIHNRSIKLSSDNAKALDVVVEIFHKEKLYKEYKYIALLLPTAPFRNYNHIKEGFKKFDSQTDGIISITDYEFPPQLGFSINKKNKILLNKSSPLITGNTRSQDQSKIYRPNGGFYIQKTNKFKKNLNFWKGRIKPYYMSREKSVDIDSKLDLDYANFLLKNEKN